MRRTDRIVHLFRPARSGLLTSFWTACAEFGCLVALIPSRNIVLDMSSNAVASVGEAAGEPRSKKQRTSETGNNAFQPDGPVEDEATAREKMEEVGLDPNDVKKQCRLTEEAADDLDLFGERTMSPMSYFCNTGDLKMCRYLLSKGASTTEASEYQYTDKRCWWFPMYTAAIGGQLEACKWLCKHGAEGDINKTNEGDFSPVHCSFSSWCKRQHEGAVCRWLILKGALSDDTGRIDSKILCRDLESEYDPDYDVDGWIDERPNVLRWAQEAVQAHDRFMVFLSGTLPVPKFTRTALRDLLVSRLRSEDAADIFLSSTCESQCKLVWEKMYERRHCCSLAMYFGGKIGLLGHIADYAGIVRGRELLIMRTLIEPLSEYLEEVPEKEEIIDESSESGSESDSSG